ncbi:7439_t:CDS:2, partial [Cetraspora pellucida]
MKSGKEESNYLESSDIVLKDEYQTFKFHIIKEGVYLPKHKLKYTQCPVNVESVHKILTSNEIVRMKPFNDYSISAQRKHVLGLGKWLLEIAEKEKENFFHLNDNIILKQAKFEINSCTYNINFGKINKRKIELQTQAIVKAGAVYDMRQEITNRVNEKIPISLVDIDQLTSFEPITEDLSYLFESNTVNTRWFIERSKISDIIINE